jgi:hypothetical protein
MQDTHLIQGVGIIASPGGVYYILRWQKAQAKKCEEEAIAMSYFNSTKPIDCANIIAPAEMARTDKQDDVPREGGDEGDAQKPPQSPLRVSAVPVLAQSTSSPSARGLHLYSPFEKPAQ